MKHGPTGETWELACDEERGEVMPSGWPMTIAKSADCTLVKSASDEERMTVLTEWAKVGRDYEAERDMRTLAARRQLAAGAANTLNPKPTAEEWWTKHATLLAARMRIGGVRMFRVELTPRGTYEFEVDPVESPNHQLLRGDGNPGAAPETKQEGQREVGDSQIAAAASPQVPEVGAATQQSPSTQRADLCGSVE